MPEENVTEIDKCKTTHEDEDTIGHEDAPDDDVKTPVEEVHAKDESEADVFGVTGAEGSEADPAENYKPVKVLFVSSPRHARLKHSELSQSHMYCRPLAIGPDIVSKSTEHVPRRKWRRGGSCGHLPHRK